MTTSITKNALRVALLGAAALALPAIASAQMYAYVNQSGEVRTVDAATWQAAISAAPGIHPRSGVIIITSPGDDLVGDDVSGI